MPKALTDMEASAVATTLPLIPIYSTKFVTYHNYSAQLPPISDTYSTTAGLAYISEDYRIEFSLSHQNAVFGALSL